ncbi:MAG: hypothetical protein AB7W47_13480 [Calditrichaceae bacterium]
MSKKYVFFKLFNDLDDPFEIEQLSFLEIESLFEKPKPLANVFELLNYQDLRHLILREPNLQQYLTDSISSFGRHGYLWVGDQISRLPDAILRLGLTKEIILIQHIADPVPLFLRAKFKNFPFSETGTNEWRIYRFPTFQYLLERVDYISAISKNESDVDKYTKFLDEHFKPGFPAPGVKTYLANHEILNANSGGFSLVGTDMRAYSDRSKTVWMRSVINYMLPDINKVLFNPFCGTGRILAEGLLSEQSVFGVELNPLSGLFSESTIHSFDFEPAIYKKAISEILSQIHLLISSKPVAQTDLFLDRIESRFMPFWRTEKERLKNQKTRIISDEILKYILAARFLIESKYITRSHSINSFLMTALSICISNFLRKKQQRNFMSFYSSHLRELFLKHYAFYRLKQILSPETGPGEVYNRDLLTMSVLESNSADASIAWLPSGIKKAGFGNDNLPVRLLNLHGLSGELEQKLFGKSLIEDAEFKNLMNQIFQKNELFALHGEYGQAIIEKLFYGNRKEEAAGLLKLWGNHLKALEQISRITRINAKICLIIENVYFKIGRRFELISNEQILVDLVARHQEIVPLHLVNHHRKTLKKKHFGRQMSAGIFIFEKHL